MKRLIMLVAVLCIFVSLSGCATQEEMLRDNIAELEDRVSELKNEVSALEAQKATVQKEIVDIKVENGTAKYVLTIKVKQKHYNLSLEDHLKDEMNAITIQIPVDKEYFDSVMVGDTIADDFRIGSLVLKGSYGGWNITVEGKEIC
jgi:outer membrane murein-binding lipoprotein Lpp